jgi:hypothetical protein
MNYTILNPDWFYSYLDIPNLEEIKKELIVLFKKGSQSNIFQLFFSIGSSLLSRVKKVFDFGWIGKEI